MAVTAEATRAAHRRVGLVLSGGGFPAMAYHAGVLLALETDHGWDPRAADVIVGTSGGSMIAALLRSGLAVDDLAAWASHAPPRRGREPARRAIERLGEIGLSVAAPRPTWRGDTLRGRALSVLNVGVLDYTTALAALDPLFDGWPHERLLVPSVRARDGERVVFGRDVRATVPEAIAASCSIPLLFRPVRIDGSSYVDGGVLSPTHADVLLTENVDVAIVVSTVPRPHPERPDRTRIWSPLRRRAARRLADEVSALRRAGIGVLTVEPNRATARSLGRNGLSRQQTAQTIRSAFLHATTHLDESERALLRSLASAEERGEETCAAAPPVDAA